MFKIIDDDFAYHYYITATLENIISNLYIRVRWPSVWHRFLDGIKTVLVKATFNAILYLLEGMYCGKPPNIVRLHGCMSPLFCNRESSIKRETAKFLFHYLDKKQRQFWWKLPSMWQQNRTLLSNEIANSSLARKSRRSQQSFRNLGWNNIRNYSYIVNTNRNNK